MREVKFRAWDNEDEKMWKVVAIKESIWGDCEEAHILMCDFDKSPEDKATDVRLSVNYDLMQYTGLKDKNGREIYEGDLYSYILTNEFGIGGKVIRKTETQQIKPIVFENGAYYHGHDLLADVIEYDDTFTYVGNVYENPELLEAN